VIELFQLYLPFNPILTKKRGITKESVITKESEREAYNEKKQRNKSQANYKLRINKTNVEANHEICTFQSHIPITFQNKFRLHMSPRAHELSN
jgi:hypothetical protein